MLMMARAQGLRFAGASVVLFVVSAKGDNL